MKTNNSSLRLVLAAVFIISLAPSSLRAQSAEKSSSIVSEANAAQWSVQVKTIDPGDISLAPSFQLSIYESLLVELGKTKHFNHVLRDGDRNANDIASLLILKTTVEKYSAGSETKRAVTTVGGATKLTVRSQLCTRDGRVILDRTVHGNVRFLGNNLKATDNLARNIAKTIKNSSLSEAAASPRKNNSDSDSEAVVIEMP